MMDKIFCSNCDNLVRRYGTATGWACTVDGICKECGSVNYRTVIPNYPRCCKDFIKKK
jgi:hypothetical protein